MFLYKIINKINNKVYIGQTCQTLEQRWSKHCNYSQSGKSAIAMAIKKYGKENFEIKLIAICSSIDEMNYREAYYIKLFNTLSPNGYNLRTGGGNSLFSEESKRKMSISQKGVKRNRPKKQIIKKKNKNWINPQIGKLVTLESRIKNDTSNGGGKFFIVKDQNGTAVWSGYILSQCAKELSLSVGNISECLRGKRKQHKGYTFHVEVTNG